jgi:hypothetical protein
MKTADTTVRALLLASVLVFCIVHSRLFGQETQPEGVDFCDLVRDPGRYDGHFISTAATYSATVHSALLTGKACRATSTEKRYVSPSFSKDFNSSSHSAKLLFQIIKEGQSADVSLVGLVHASAHQKYGYHDAPLQLEINRIEKIKRDSSP